MPKWPVQLLKTVNFLRKFLAHMTSLKAESLLKEGVGEMPQTDELTNLGTEELVS